MDQLKSISFSDPKFLYTAGLITLSVLYLARKWFEGGKCNIKADLKGKIVVITGSNTGIGKETARIIANMGATVILASRDVEKTQSVVQELKADTKNENIEFLKLDLNDLSSVRQFVQEFKKKYQNLNILINNAGIMFLPNRETTKDGFERQFGVNHIGHFLLTNLLLDVIKKSTPARIINVSSMGHILFSHMNFDDINHTKGYDSYKAYGQSKLANVMFSKELNKRLESQGIKSVSLHPGAVRTELDRYIKEKWYINLLMKLFTPLIYFGYKNSFQGAQTSIYCAVCDFEQLKGGEYYADCKVAKINPLARKEDITKRLWDVSEELVGQKFNV